MEYRRLYILVKYNELWNKTEKNLKVKFHSKPIYDEKYLKNKVKAFNEAVNTIFFHKVKFQKKVFITFVLQQ